MATVCRPTLSSIFQVSAGTSNNRETSTRTSLNVLCEQCNTLFSSHVVVRVRVRLR